MTTPPQAVPLVTGRVLPLAPSAMTRTAPSCIIFLLALLTATLGLFGLIPVASPCPMPLCWLSTAGSSTLSMKQTLRRLSGPTSFSLATSVTNSNRRLGEVLHVPPLVPHISGLKLGLRFRYFSATAPRCQTPCQFHLLWLFAEAIFLSLCIGIRLRFHASLASGLRFDVPPLFPHIILTQASMAWLPHVPAVGCELQYFPN